MILEIVATLLRIRLPEGYVHHDAFEARNRRYPSASSIFSRTNGRIGGTFSPAPLRTTRFTNPTTELGRRGVVCSCEVTATYGLIPSWLPRSSERHAYGDVLVA